MPCARKVKRWTTLTPEIESTKESQRRTGCIKDIKLISDNQDKAECNLWAVSRPIGRGRIYVYKLWYFLAAGIIMFGCRGLAKLTLYQA